MITQSAVEQFNVGSTCVDGQFKEKGQTGCYEESRFRGGMSPQTRYEMNFRVSLTITMLSCTWYPRQTRGPSALGRLYLARGGAKQKERWFGKGLSNNLKNLN